MITATTPTPGTTQYLTYKLESETFAFDIGKVREVLDYEAVTRVPRTPEFMRGVINLRGSVVPVVDLKLKFGMPRTEKTVNTCIIIAEVSVAGESTVLGAMADSVQEVVDLAADHVEPAPKIGTTVYHDFILGMGKQNEHFIMILDLDKIFSAEEMSMVKATQEAGSGLAAA